MSVGQLYIQVTKSDEDNWKNQRRVIAWIKRTIDYPRKIRATVISNVFIWIDTAYTVHDDTMSKTRGTISMSCGALHCHNAKQKLNVKVTIETEIVGTSNHVTYNLWLVISMWG